MSPMPHNEQPPARISGLEGIHDISAQLVVSEGRYREALEHGDTEYLTEMKSTLVAFINNIHVEFGTLSSENKLVLEKVKQRLSEIDEALETEA